MTVVKIIAATCLLAISTTGCSTPQSVAISQPVAVQRGDSFALLSPAKSETPAGVRDAMIGQTLAQHIGGKFGADNPRWLVEYSFSARPAKIIMTQQSNGQIQAVGLPVESYLIDCERANVRLSLRIVDASSGAAAYHSTVEEQACVSALNGQDAFFARLANEAIAGVILQ